jgi:signal peptidase
VDGEASGYSKYGAYGDVIIYRPNGLAERLDGSRVIPIIHRLVLWVEINSTRVDPGHGGIDYANYSFDVPSLGLRDTAGEVVLSDYGFWRDTVRIYLGEILSDFEARGKTPHGGFITKGDHNDGPDQPSYEPVLPEWIVGKAWGELPWFGLIKLRATGANLSGVPGNSWVNLGVTLAIVITVPLALDFILPRLGKAKKASQQQADDRAGEEKAAPDAPPPQPDPETPQGDAPGSSLENAPK